VRDDERVSRSALRVTATQSPVPRVVAAPA